METSWAWLCLAAAICGCSNARLDDHEKRIAKLEAEIRLLQQSSSPSPRPDASASSGREPCARAKVAAHDKWQEVIPLVNAAAKKFPSDCADSNFVEPCGGELECVRSKQGACFGRAREGAPFFARAAAAKKALAATSQGAMKIRDTANAVTDAPDIADVTEAKKASQAAFEACKDVDP